MISVGCQKYNTFLEDVQKKYGVVHAFAVKTAMTGLVYGVVVAALAALAKAFASICARAGYTTFAARIALPALLTNPWFVVAICVGVQVLNLFINGSKTKKKEESEKCELSERELKVCNALEEQMKSTMAGDYDLETSGVETRILTDENKKNIIDYLQKKYQTQIFVLSNLSNELYCRWAKKTLNKDETELFEKINTAICKAILIARVDRAFSLKRFDIFLQKNLS
jgi:hypothetical protein